MPGLKELGGRGLVYVGEVFSGVIDRDGKIVAVNHEGRTGWTSADEANGERQVFLSPRIEVRMVRLHFGQSSIAREDWHLVEAAFAAAHAGRTGHGVLYSSDD